MSLSFLLTAALAAADLGSHITMRELRQGVLIEDLVFRNSQKTYTAAYRVCPAKAAKQLRPAILYVHWYDPEEHTSNRTQFLPEAIDLARRGVCSLHVETLWSSPDWFQLRDRAKDRPFTERQIARLGDALNFLLATPGVDVARVAYVGHDFGGMAGASLAAKETRIKAWVIAAATPRWSDWYIFGPKLDEAARARIIEATAAFEPVTNIAKAKGAFLFQFANTDQFVPRARAEEFFAAAPQPKEIRWYEAGHGLNDAARQERVKWLAQQLQLR